MKDQRGNSQVDVYFNQAKAWAKELRKFRSILLDCGLREELKWAKPCYMFEQSNVVILLPLKNHCALLFCKGALLDDPKGILIQPSENTQAARQIRFTDIRQIEKLESTLKAYVRQAIEVEKAGLDVVYRETADFEFPAELQSILDSSPALKKAFADLTPGRQRGYLLHFAAPKQSKTRTARIEKCRPLILEGKGMHDHLKSKRKVGLSDPRA